MKTEHFDLPTVEQALLDTIRALQPRRIIEVLDFARWLQTQPLVEDESSPDELETEERAWQAAYDANRDEFRAMAREALAELDAGETVGMVVRKGKIYPE